MKRIIRIALGSLFLLLGVVGLILPVLQGILFLIAGLLILSPESRRIRTFLGVLRRRYPAIFEQADRLHRKFRPGTGA